MFGLLGGYVTGQEVVGGYADRLQPSQPPPPRRSRVADAMRRRPLTAFFVLAFAYSWSLSLVYLATGSGPAILSCGPTLAALTVLPVTKGRAGVRELCRAMLKWRVARRWWAIALLAPIAVTSLATALNVALGAEMPSADDLGNWTTVLPTALLILCVPAIGGAWEEPGWRGVALPGLLARQSALRASLVLGVLWSLWHVPVFLTGDQHWSDLALVMAVTVVLTWLFENAGASVLIAMVFHALNNSFSGEYASQMFDGADSTRQSWMLVVVWSVAALLVVRFGRAFRRSDEPNWRGRAAVGAA
jgi:membrane protease YdiL (CAAX protease family)